jgi:PilZ domain-containing protein
MEQEHRGAARFPFIAAAEVLAENNGARMRARISDLGVSGCYVDTINPLPDGTLVQVKIITETQIFEAPARVVYSRTRLGMGLAFREVLPNFAAVLQNWLPATV